MYISNLFSHFILTFFFEKKEERNKVKHKSAIVGGKLEIKILFVAFLKKCIF
jgi:hypothetical protein